MKTHSKHKFNPQTDNEFNGYGTSLLRLFRHSVGDFAFDLIGADEYYNGLATALLVGWTICSNVVMLNILIALMSGTYQHLASDATRIWQFQRARTIQQMDDRFGTAPFHASLFNPLGWLRLAVSVVRWPMIALSVVRAPHALAEWIDELLEPWRPYVEKETRKHKFYVEDPQASSGRDRGLFPFAVFWDCRNECPLFDALA